MQDQDLTPTGPVMEREAPDPAPARSALVTEWQKRLTEARTFWTKEAFERMVSDMKFAAGHQWSDNKALRLADGTVLDAEDVRYVANITLRHIQQRTASIYGKNPKIVAKRKPRLLNTVWDGSQMQFMSAMQSLATGSNDPMSMAIVQDAVQSTAENQRITKIAKTLELLMEHEIDEQPLNFKTQMKGTVRKGLTTGVSYVKLGYQRIMGLSPDVEGQIETVSQQLAAIERLSADLADGEIDPNQAQAEELRLLMQALSTTDQTVLREGLLLSYPDSTAIIPDPNTKQLRGFVGAGWVAEEFYLSPDKIKEIYKVDLAASASADLDAPRPKIYEQTGSNSFRPSDHSKDNAAAYHCVWEIYNRDDGLVYVVCEGYRDFLVEPSAPDVTLERFYPWFPFVVNEVYSPGDVFPPSDVQLMRDMQMELNRSRQGLREHRRAARPRTYVRKGSIEQQDKDKLMGSVAFEVVELNALGPSEKITDILQDYSGPRIDPALYETNSAYEDYLRAVGQQEANLGGTSGATATEASIAEGSRSTNVSSIVDDLDEFLAELARAAGQVLLMECSRDKVMRVVGPGAVWPDLSKEEVMREIYLDVEAASTGRPNKAAEVQVAQAVFPLLMQIPNLDPEWLARELLRRMDDRLDLTDAFASGMPSVQMLNQAKSMLGAGQGAATDPAAQGAQGAGNAPSTQPPRVNAAPVPQQPGVQPEVGVPGQG